MVTRDPKGRRRSRERESLECVCVRVCTRVWCVCTCVLGGRGSKVEIISYRVSQNLPEPGPCSKSRVIKRNQEEVIGAEGGFLESKVDVGNGLESWSSSPGTQTRVKAVEERDHSSPWGVISADTGY